MCSSDLVKINTKTKTVFVLKKALFNTSFDESLLDDLFYNLHYCLILCAFSLWAMTEAVLYYISFQTKTQWVAILNLWAWSNRLQSWCFGPHLALSFIFRNLEIRNKTQTGQSQETKMKTVSVGLLGVIKRHNMMSSIMSFSHCQMKTCSYQSTF